MSRGAGGAGMARGILGSGRVEASNGTGTGGDRVGTVPACLLDQAVGSPCWPFVSSLPIECPSPPRALPPKATGILHPRHLFPTAATPFGGLSVTARCYPACEPVHMRTLYFVRGLLRRPDIGSELDIVYRTFARLLTGPGSSKCL